MKYLELNKNSIITYLICIILWAVFIVYYDIIPEESVSIYTAIFGVVAWQVSKRTLKRKLEIPTRKKFLLWFPISKDDYFLLQHIEYQFLEARTIGLSPYHSENNPTDLLVLMARMEILVMLFHTKED